MHEVRITAPAGSTDRVVGLALQAGISQATVYDVFVHGPNEKKHVISVETSTPQAKAFVDSVFASDWFDTENYSITTRELRAIFSAERIRDITKPMIEPALDVLEDLWQLNHITPSYVGRAAGAAILLAYGMFHNSAIAIVVAALFLPFLSQVLAIGFGLRAGDRGLAKQGAAALALSTVLSIAGGIIVGLFFDRGISYTEFESPLVAFAISSVIGAAAGLASADDAGRRYLIGVAAAVQYAVFPVWVGTAVVHGFPAAPVITERIGAFFTNMVTIAVVAACVYAWAGMRKEDVNAFRSKMKGGYAEPK
jgi:hypothetical protein